MSYQNVSFTITYRNGRKKTLCYKQKTEQEIDAYLCYDAPNTGRVLSVFVCVNGTQPYCEWSPN